MAAPHGPATTSSINHQGDKEILMKKWFALLVSLFVVGTVGAQSAEPVGQVIAQYHTTALGDELGYSSALVGDVNGDGYADILTGATNDSDGGLDAGAAYLVLGSPAGHSLNKELDQLPAIKYIGEADNDRAGASVAGAGDVNGDGFDDMLVTAPGSSFNLGAVYLILGSANPTGGSLATAIRYTGGLPGGLAGNSVAGVGDANGDGLDDFLVGSSAVDLVYLVFGTAAPTGGDLALSPIYFGGANSLTGYRVANAGDVNGDGYGDMLVSSPNNPTGLIYLILGDPAMAGGDLNTVAVVYTAENVDDQVGWDGINGAGDVNGDGYADFLVGASAYSSNGVVYLVLGSASPFDNSLGSHKRYEGISSNGPIGSIVGPAGDVNGDGYDDFLISATQFNWTSPGGFYVQLGSSAPAGGLVDSPHQFLIGTNSHTLFGGQDVNGDGFSDWLESSGTNDRVTLIAGGHNASALPAYQHHRRLGDNLDGTGRSLPVEFVQAGVQVAFTQGAQPFGDVSVTRHIFHPCNTQWRLPTPIWDVDTGKAYDPAVGMDVRFKYTNNHIATMDEANLTVWTRPAGQPCSPWTEVTNVTRDPDHNFITAHLNGPLPVGQFTIAESEPPPTDVQVSAVDSVSSVRLFGEPVWMVVLLALMVIAAGVVHWRLRHGYSM